MTAPITNEKATEGLSPIQLKIEGWKVELLKCTDQAEIEAKLAETEKDVGIPMAQVDKYGMMIQALLMDKFHGVDKKGQVTFEPGTWERFCNLWLLAVKGR